MICTTISAVLLQGSAVVEQQDLVRTTQTSVHLRFSGSEPAQGHLFVEYAVKSAHSSVAISLPSSWAGRTDLRRFVGSVNMTSGQIDLSSGPPDVLHVAPGRTAKVRYASLATNFETATWFGQPLAGPGWYFAFGHSLFAGFDGVGVRVVPPADGASVTFTSLPLPATQSRDYGNKYDARDSFVLVRTNVERHSRVVGKTTVEFAYPKGVSVESQGLFADAEDAFTALTSATGEFSPAAYRIAVVPFGKTDRPFFQGTAFPGGVALLVSGGGATDQRWLVAHELTHEWLPLRISGLDPRSSATDQYWFSESFTEFWSRHALLMARKVSLEDYIARWNTTLKQYGTSKLNRISQAELRARYWKEEDANQIPYQRGALLALRWHSLLLSKTRQTIGLDDILREALRPIESGSALERVSRGLALRRFQTRTEILRFIENGELIRIDKEVFQRCASVEDMRTPAFDRGFAPIAAPKGGWIARQVDRSSNAFAAGLRDGMRVVGLVSGDPGNSAIDYVLRIQSDGVGRTIRYRPVGGSFDEYQRITLTSYGRKHPRHCSRLF